MNPTDRRQLLTDAAATATALSLSTLSLSACGRRTAEFSETDRQLGRTPNTRFAINLEWWWADLPFVDRIARAAELGFPAIEFWLPIDKDLSAIRATCQAHAISVAHFAAWALEPGLLDTSDHRHFLNRIREACRAARLLDTKLLTVLAGDRVPGLSAEATFGRLVAAFKQAVAVAADHDVTLLVEPLNSRYDHPEYVLSTSSDATRLCREVASPRLKINWDFYHRQITEGDLCGHVREYWDHVGYLQIADHPGRNEPGTGEIDYRRVLQEVHSLGYRGFVGVECRPRRDELSAARAIAQLDQG